GIHPVLAHGAVRERERGVTRSDAAGRSARKHCLATCTVPAHAAVRERERAVAGDAPDSEATTRAEHRVVDAGEKVDRRTEGEARLELGGTAGKNVVGMLLRLAHPPWRHVRRRHLPSILRVFPIGKGCAYGDSLR